MVRMINLAQFSNDVSEGIVHNFSIYFDDESSKWLESNKPITEDEVTFESDCGILNGFNLELIYE